jgi:hypothetical protein
MISIVTLSGEGRAGCNGERPWTTASSLNSRQPLVIIAAHKQAQRWSRLLMIESVPVADERRQTRVPSWKKRRIVQKLPGAVNASYPTESRRNGSKKAIRYRALKKLLHRCRDFDHRGLYTLVH